MDTVKNYFDLKNWQIIVIFGIAISSVASFINTYDYLSGINDKLISCTESDVLQKQLNVQFIVVIVLSCLAFILGVILAGIFRKDNKKKLVTLSLVASGIAGILYALNIKFQNTTNIIKLSISWASLAAFILIGFFLSTHKKTLTP